MIEVSHVLIVAKKSVHICWVRNWTKLTSFIITNITNWDMFNSPFWTKFNHLVNLVVHSKYVILISRRKLSNFNQVVALVRFKTFKIHWKIIYMFITIQYRNLKHHKKKWILRQVWSGRSKPIASHNGPDLRIEKETKYGPAQLSK